MERLACVDVPALPLQLLVRGHPDWRREPVAVVDRDAPQGTVLWVNERARASEVLPGLRYGAALALCASLRAGAVDERQVESGVEELCDVLRRSSPSVEPSREEPGVFFVDVAGLALVQPSLVEWARRARADVVAAGFACALAVGFDRFASYAIAKSLRGESALVFGRPQDERELALRVPLRRIALDPSARAELEKLAIRRVGDLVRLPAEGVLLRFGPELHRLHRVASGLAKTALEARAPREPPRAAVDLDWPLADAAAILALVEEMARPLIFALARADRAVAALALSLSLEDRTRFDERVEPAEPTLEWAQLARLLKLRLDRLAMAPATRGASRRVERVEIELSDAPATRQQLRLFAQRAGRDPRAAAKCFAALRAAFGDDAVVRAKLASAHLPEASFAWERLEKLEAPRPSAVDERPPLVRRIHTKSVPLAPRSRHEHDGWMPLGFERGPVMSLQGPFPLSGGWWRAEVARDYYFAELASGEELWIYYDRRRRRWFAQGSVA